LNTDKMPHKTLVDSVYTNFVTFTKLWSYDFTFRVCV
jgi:hypothetical protein